MTAVLGAVVGLGMAVGILLVARGIVGTTAPLVPARIAWWPKGRRVGLVGFAGLIAFLLTGWLAAGAIVAAAMVIVPFLIDARNGRDEALERTESLAAWAEMLRDTIAGHAGLREAIGVTAEVAPQAIRPAVLLLVARAEHESLSSGLARFAEDVAHPTSDLIVAALSIAADGQARNLPALLTSIANTARAEAQMQVRVETGRARTYSSSRSMLIIAFVLSVSLFVFAPEFMAPFASLWGQLVLLLIGGLFSGALWGLVVLSRPEPWPRLLAGVGDPSDRVLQ